MSLFSSRLLGKIVVLLNCALLCSASATTSSQPASSNTVITIQSARMQLSSNKRVLLVDCEYVLRTKLTQLECPVVSVHALLSSGGTLKLIRLYSAKTQEGFEFKEWYVNSNIMSQPLVSTSDFAANGVVKVNDRLSDILGGYRQIVCYCFKVYAEGQLLAARESAGIQLLLKTGKVRPDWQVPGVYGDRYGNEKGEGGTRLIFDSALEK